MPKLPQVSGIKVIKALNKFGYEIDHQTGSHIILRPNHKILAKGTLRAIIRQAGLTVEDFLDLL